MLRPLALLVLLLPSVVVAQTPDDLARAALAEAARGLVKPAQPKQPAVVDDPPCCRVPDRPAVTQWYDSAYDKAHTLCVQTNSPLLVYVGLPARRDYLVPGAVVTSVETFPEFNGRGLVVCYPNGSGRMYRLAEWQGVPSLAEITAVIDSQRPKVVVQQITIPQPVYYAPSYGSCAGGSCGVGYSRGSYGGCSSGSCGSSGFSRGGGCSSGSCGSSGGMRGGFIRGGFGGGGFIRGGGSGGGCSGGR